MLERDEEGRVRITEDVLDLYEMDISREEQHGGSDTLGAPSPSAQRLLVVRHRMNMRISAATNHGEEFLNYLSSRQEFDFDMLMGTGQQFGGQDTELRVSGRARCITSSIVTCQSLTPILNLEAEIVGLPTYTTVATFTAEEPPQFEAIPMNFGNVSLVSGAIDWTNLPVLPDTVDVPPAVQPVAPEGINFIRRPKRDLDLNS